MKLVIQQDAFGYWVALTNATIVARHLGLDRVLWEARVYLSGMDTDDPVSGASAQPRAA